MGSLLEQMGGPELLREVVDDFVDRMIADAMIGFHFRGVDPVRLKVLEAQFAAVALGSSEPYEGRPVRTTHARHPISGGQFSRRKEILRQTLHDHGVAVEVATAWLDHTERLRGAVVRGPQDRCGSAGAHGVLYTEVAADGTETAAPGAAG